MYCRSRPQYRSDLGWILGVALARSPDRPGLHRASLTFGAAARLRLLPHTASRRQAGLSRDAPTCVQLPSACGCFQLAPQRTCTSNPGSMPGTPRVLAVLASPPATKALDPDPFPRRSLRHAVYAALLHFGFESASEIRSSNQPIGQGAPRSRTGAGPIGTCLPANSTPG